jgi:type IV pilus assembly protein PilW
MKKINSKYQQGFSLLEVFVALAIGLVIFAGVLSVFVGMRTTTTETSNYGELQENGRFAVSLLTGDLLRQDLWGDYTGTFDLASISPVPVAPGNDCNGGGVNNGSFPLAIGTFRTLWGQTITAAGLDPLGCFPSAADTKTKVGSDVVQFKRVLAAPFAAVTAGESHYYLTANTNSGTVLTNLIATTVANARSWQYQHHVYYVREEKQGSDYVPVLMQGRLVNYNMKFEPIIDGIEMIRFMYGVDLDDDGIVDAFISAGNMTDALWDHKGGTDNVNNTNKSLSTRILAVKVYVLARNVLPDNKYTDTKTYQLGDVLVPAQNDHYRRLLFSSTITLHNASIDSW